MMNATWNRRETERMWKKKLQLDLVRERISNAATIYDSLTLIECFLHSSFHSWYRFLQNERSFLAQTGNTLSPESERKQGFTIASFSVGSMNGCDSIGYHFTHGSMLVDAMRTKRHSAGLARKHSHARMCSEIWVWGAISETIFTTLAVDIWFFSLCKWNFE